MIEQLSASQIQNYMDCSLKYKFNYIDKFPKPFKASGLAFGGAIDAAVDWLHKKWKTGTEVSLEAVWAIFEADWYAQAVDTIRYAGANNEEDLLNLGRSLIGLYCNHAPREGVIDTQVPFRVPLVDFRSGETLDIPLVGIIDKIEEGDVVSDLKAWARKASQEDLDGNIQFSAYGYAYRVMFKKDPELRVDALIKTKTPRFEQMHTSRGEAEHSAFFNLCKQVYNGIQKEVFFPNPSWKCRDCEFRDKCWFWNGKK